VAVCLATFRKVLEPVSEPILLLLIGTKGRESRVMDLGSIALAGTMPRERRIHNYKVEMTVPDTIYKVSDLFGTSSTRRLRGGLDYIERRLLFQ
jgi:hypothetical protein